MDPVLKVKYLDHNAVMPSFSSASAAGADLYALLPSPITISPGETVFVGTGIAIEIPEGYAGFVFARSGLSTKQGIAPANKVGVIDADYRGEVKVALFNHSSCPVNIEPFQRIAQLVIMPVTRPVFQQVSELSETERGQGGFGSTGN